jgi:cytochrome c biogenesis protein CcmG, thiol:disulfide interchange protein DsbE
MVKLRVSRWVVIGAAAALGVGLAGCKESASTNAAGKMSAKASPNAGKPAEPDVTFPQLQGGDLALPSLKGKVVLVNFWATWCEPCREEIPWLIEFQDKYAKQGFTILGVAMDTEGKSVVDPFVHKTEFPVDGGSGKQETMSYPIMIGDEDLAEKFGGLIGLPTSVLISRDGKVVKRYIGEVEKNELQSDIETQLAYHP